MTYDITSGKYSSDHSEEKFYINMGTVLSGYGAVGRES
jgi:hypothetical protein